MKKSKEEMLKLCALMCENTLMETLNIEFVDVDEHTITARMPVTPRVHQPDGVLHGGATVALAESVGSAAAYLFLGSKDLQVRGIEISANHVKSIRDGYVYANARIVHKGRTTQLWHIDIKNEQNELISFIKLTTLTLNQ
jgi:1,4-dihydroxy-2-naphthoyl-CoA hydrolase